MFCFKSKNVTLFSFDVLLEPFQQISNAWKCFPAVSIASFYLLCISLLDDSVCSKLNVCLVFILMKNTSRCHTFSMNS